MGLQRASVRRSNDRPRGFCERQRLLPWQLDRGYAGYLSARCGKQVMQAIYGVGSSLKDSNVQNGDEFPLPVSC